MEKYLSFRIEKIANHKAKNSYNHNIRKGYQPKYIDTKKSQRNITLRGDRNLNIDLYKREQNKRSKRKIQKNSTRFLGGIMTFSSEIKKDYEDNPDLFLECSNKFLEEIEQHLGLKILSAELHLDEQNPHIHLFFDNISEFGKTINRTITPEKLSEAQTLMGNSFSPMGYIRGIVGSKNTHISVKELHKLNELKEKLQKECNGYKLELKIFEKLMDNEKLNKEEIEVLKILASSLFQFVVKDNVQQKKILSNNIQKAMRL